jgi:hypothetical protein
VLREMQVLSIEVLQEAAGEYIIKRQIRVHFICLAPCSALPNSAVILRCFFLRYLLTPGVTLALQTRAGATTGGINPQRATE